MADAPIAIDLIIFLRVTAFMFLFFGKIPQISFGQPA
jgi:hypothetical protein